LHLLLLFAQFAVVIAKVFHSGDFVNFLLRSLHQNLES
jgi:hypothetical protein